MKKIVTLLMHFLFNILFAQFLMRNAAQGQRKKILISGYTGLGHFILKTVLIYKIREVYPNCEILIIAGNKYGTEFVVPQYRTFLLNPNVSTFVKFVFFWKLRNEKIDVIFLPFDAAPRFLILGSIIAGIPIRVGNVFNHLNIPSYYYTHPVIVNNQTTRNEIDLNLDLLQALSKTDFRREYLPHIHHVSDLNLLVELNLRKDEYICIQISGANGNLTNKLWLEENFRELIIQLSKTHSHLKILAIGDKGDSTRVNRVCNGLEMENLINLSGKTSLNQIKGLINDCIFLICHDSGLLHMANALGKNVIALYGFSEPDVYALKLSTCHIIQKKCDCPQPKPGLFPGMFEPTELEFSKKCPVPECMKRIKVEDVLQKCFELLETN